MPYTMPYKLRTVASVVDSVACSADQRDNKKVSYRKQIARQHSCHNDVGQGKRLRRRPFKNFPLI